MNIKCLNKLSEKQSKDIHCLVDCCNKYDGTKNELFLSNEFNIYPEMNSFFLYYNDEKIIGVLVVHATLEERANISAYILPEVRQKGIFTRLFNTASEELKHFGYNSVRFKTEKIFKPAEIIMQKYMAQKVSSEFIMYYNKLLEMPVNQPAEGMVVLQAKKEDWKRLIQIDAEAFQNSIELSELNIKDSFSNPSVHFFAILNKDDIMGSCCVDTEGKCNLIYSLCIDRKYQKKGIGTFLFHEVVHKTCMMNSKPISLIVDLENIHALNMYKSCGFEIVTELNFYSAAI
jgi:ribosomal protein S18 acetylase RimI-like enzyme